MLRPAVISLLGLLSIASGASAQTCAGNPVAVQILGSGGPAINPERASAGYLLWVGTQAKLLFDMGGGAYFRFGQSRAKLADLAMVGISHLHPDHTSDLAALMWGSSRMRSEPLPIVGPSGNNVAPDFATSSAACSTRRPARSRCSARRSAPCSRRGAPASERQRRRCHQDRADQGARPRRHDHNRVPHPARQSADARISGADARCVGRVRLRSERHRPEIRRLREGRERADHASGHRRRRATKPVARRAGGRRPHRPRRRRRRSYSVTSVSSISKRPSPSSRRPMRGP
jgi:ribonuclease BN (tRNA processing enzyme)